MTVSPSYPIGFAYIGGIKSDDVQFEPGSKELTVTLTATQNGADPPPDPAPPNLGFRCEAASPLVA